MVNNKVIEELHFVTIVTLAKLCRVCKGLARLVAAEPCNLMVRAQGKGLGRVKQVETKEQGKSIWSGRQDRPLDRQMG